MSEPTLEQIQEKIEPLPCPECEQPMRLTLEGFKCQCRDTVWLTPDAAEALVGFLAAEVERLRAESAHWEQVAKGYYVDTAGQGFEEEFKRLKEENERLRVELRRMTEDRDKFYKLWKRFG